MTENVLITGIKNPEKIFAERRKLRVYVEDCIGMDICEVSCYTRSAETNGLLREFVKDLRHMYMTDEQLDSDKIWKLKSFRNLSLMSEVQVCSDLLSPYDELVKTVVQFIKQGQYTYTIPDIRAMLANANALHYPRGAALTDAIEFSVQAIIVAIIEATMINKRIFGGVMIEGIPDDITKVSNDSRDLHWREQVLALQNVYGNDLNRLLEGDISSEIDYRVLDLLYAWIQYGFYPTIEQLANLQKLVYPVSKREAAPFVNDAQGYIQHKPTECLQTYSSANVQAIEDFFEKRMKKFYKEKQPEIDYSKEVKEVEKEDTQIEKSESSERKKNRKTYKPRPEAKPDAYYYAAEKYARDKAHASWNGEELQISSIKDITDAYNEYAAMMRYDSGWY